ncbi:hypothetical protein KQX54_018465 [Cotesia glomerata]|uniref:Uncharacterized protein n=1 Tax=Cotesia glomerata TaxID=32391 RepID=A0AAV7ID14_COTGL|nr:hypothetical protein KQX54_018465 [Cotesia glomerata]
MSKMLQDFTDGISRVITPLARYNYRVTSLLAHSFLLLLLLFLRPSFWHAGTSGHERKQVNLKSSREKQLRGAVGRYSWSNEPSELPDKCYFKNHKIAVAISSSNEEEGSTTMPDHPGWKTSSNDRNCLDPGDGEKEGVRQSNLVRLQEQQQELVSFVCFGCFRMSIHCHRLHPLNDLQPIYPCIVVWHAIRLLNLLPPYTLYPLPTNRESNRAERKHIE